MPWQQFLMDIGSLDAARVEAVLLRHGAHSVTLSDAGDKPVLEPGPGETPLWGDTRITGLFSAGADLDALVDDLLSSFGLDAMPRYSIEPLEDREWEREWLRDFGPMRFGRRLWVLPGDAEADSDDAVVVRLDPGLAFGTGTHPTTAMCLEWLDGLPLAGKTLLDYGCGSGVLAIAALKLGARAATGMDIDPQAVTATRQNAERNGVLADLAVVGADEEIEGRYDVVVANILAGPLAELVESLTARLSSGGKLALSGILSDQVDAVRAAYAGHIAFDPPAYQAQGDQTWARLSGQRR
ncbi:MAG: 50S ribosomal protein L11 methyltransferase [Woeseiaceae bacterium]|nr:50S ribosomal protein L11 methyltransferase [Woeseiaceae bacterium]